jgi:membrane protein YdbS with pleckstrin-like domain
MGSQSQRKPQTDTMPEESPPTSPPRRIPGWAQLRVWHLALLVLFVAIAIADIQDQRIHEPALIALAAGGLMLYGLIGWIGWWAARRRLESRLGPLLLFLLYAIAMGALFLVATVIYLVIAHVHRGGRF